jgi:hypothetical protein
MYLSMPKRKGAVRTADFPPSSSIGSALAPLPSVWGCDIFDSWQWPRLCDYVSQAEALWESKSQIVGLACQDTRYKGPVYQAARLN